MSRRRGTPNDPTGRLGSRDDTLTKILNKLGENRAAVLTQYFVYGWSLRTIAEFYDVSHDEAARMVWGSLSAFRHPTNAHNRLFVDDGSPSTTDEFIDPRPVMGWRLQAVTIPASMHYPCRHCGEALSPVRLRTGGRPRRYCSSPCRQAAYRARRRAQLGR